LGFLSLKIPAYPWHYNLAALVGPWLVCQATIRTAVRNNGESCFEAPSAVGADDVGIGSVRRRRRRGDPASSEGGATKLGGQSDLRQSRLSFSQLTVKVRRICTLTFFPVR
jgi:hypothetical protein